MRSGQDAVDTHTAIARARAAADAVARIGVATLVTGSLARGEFRLGSDVDFLVTRCPRHLKYAIEGIVEDCLEGLRFDVIYLDEIPDAKRAWFLDGAKRAQDLG